MPVISFMGRGSSWFNKGFNSFSIKRFHAINVKINTLLLTVEKKPV
jgi:hypothetical protein